MTTASQLTLFLEERAGESAAPAPRAPLRLVVVRGRGHLWARERERDVVVWTVHELMERVRLLGFLADPDGAVRDDDADLWAAAAELASRTPFAPRIAPELRGLFRTLIHENVDDNEVASALAGKGGRQDELAELFSELRGVRQRLESAAVVGADLALARGISEVERGVIPPALRAFAEVVICDPLDVLPLQLRALAALGRAGLPLRVQLPRVEGRDGLTEGIHWIAQALEAELDAPDLELSHTPIAGRGALARVVESWYRPSLDPPSRAPCRVEVLGDPVDEAGRVAGIVAAWRREAVPPRIAVAVRTLDAQADRIAEAIMGHGVPVRLARGVSLADSPPGRVLLDLIRARRQGGPRELVLSVLASPAFSGALAPEEVGGLARLLRRAVARTDVEDATRPQGGYRHRLERWAAGRDAEEPKDAARARAAVDLVERVLEPARRFEMRASLGQHLAACVDTVGDACTEDEEGARDRLLELLDRWRHSLERVAPAGTRDVDLAAFLRLLDRELSGRHLAPPRTRDDAAVEVLTLPELFGRRFDYVAIADAQHGRMPLAERNETLLSDADRGLINQTFGRRVLPIVEADALEPGPVPARQALEPLWFLGAMAAAERGLLVTSPSRDGRGREVAPSEFLQEVLLALGADPEARAAGPLFAEEAHPRRTQVRLAQHVAAGAAGVGDPAQIERARELAEAAAQRRAFFMRVPGSDPRPFVDTYAFALSPSRVERRFGRDLGLAEDKPLTPTRLEALAGCRMRGYVEYLLRVETDREGGHDADARVLGTIAHRALETFFRERRDAGTDPARMDADDRARLRSIVDENARPYLEGGEATGHLGALRANVTWLQRSLVRTVTGLARNPPVPGAVPRHFELKVGTRGWEESEEKIGPARIRVGDRQLWIGGEIDRVDEGPGVRVVVDYKHSTGRAVWAKLKPENLLESHFQLPLYLLALEQGDMRTPDGTELLAYLVSLRDAATSRVIGEGGVLRRRLLDENAATGFSQSLSRVLEPIFAGAIAPDEGGHCYSCQLRRVCRVPIAAERGLDEATAETTGDPGPTGGAP